MQSWSPYVFQWFLDTRLLWPIPDGLHPKESMLIFGTTVTTPLHPRAINPANVQAAESLSLLQDEERQAVLRYYHPKDARMSLGSHLLKRYAICKLLDIPWADVEVSRSFNGKPVYIPTLDRGTGQRRIDFNVSHQAGVVTLVACAHPNPLANDFDAGRSTPYSPDSKTLSGEIDLGTDIVCLNERDDHSRIAREGFYAFVDTYADVLAPSETQALKMDSSSQLCLFPEDEEDKITGYTRDAISQCQFPEQDIQVVDTDGEVTLMKGATVIEAKLRRFFALWCLREAWVKMTGDALLADWLHVLEFKGFRIPRPVPASTHTVVLRDGSNISASSEEASREPFGQRHTDVWSQSLEQGELFTEEEMQVWFKGGRVTDVKIQLRAMGRNYMVATAVRRRPIHGREPVFLKEGPRPDQTDVEDIVFAAWEPLIIEDIHAIARKHHARGP